MPPSGLVTFCFTDIEGSTAMLARLGQESYAEVLEVHRAILRQAWASHGGFEVGTEGDGFFVAFSSVDAALGACVQGLVGLTATSWPEGGLVRIRMGVHSGVAFPDGGSDYTALAANQAARIASCGHGGQIVVSPTSAARCSAVGIHLRSLGHYRVRDFDDPAELFQVDADGLERNFPPLRGVGALDPFAAVAVPEWLSDRGLLKLAGRDRELATGVKALEDALSWRRRAVFVGGEPGIGKTRLVGAVASRGRERGMLVLGGRCDPQMANPYGPFTDALRQVIRSVDTSALADCLGRWPQELSRIVPELRDALPELPKPLVSDVATERWRLFDAVVSALSALAEVGGLVLVLDDLQWAPPATLSLLRHLLRVEAPLRVAVLATFRDTVVDEQHPLNDLIVELRGSDDVETLSVGGLDNHGMSNLVEAAAGHSLDENGVALSAMLTESTAGNPYFAVEMLRHLSERGELRSQDGRWVLTTDLERLALPTEVRMVIRQRVTSLGKRTERVLGLCAVAGASFDLGVVRVADGNDDDDCLDVFEHAARAHLVVETGRDQWRFVHALVRATLYDDMTESRRAEYHRRVAEALEKSTSSEPAALGHHWSHASGSDALGRAAICFDNAGRDAMRRLAPVEAATLFESALACDAMADSPNFGEAQRIEVSIELGGAQRRAGCGDFRTTLMAAARAAKSLGRADLVGMAGVEASRGWFATIGEFDVDYIGVLEDALESLPTTPTSLRARLLVILAAELLFHPERERRFALSHEALVLARIIGDPQTTFDVLAQKLLCTMTIDSLSDVWRDASELRALAEITADPHRVVLASIAYYFIGLQAGHLDEVAPVLIEVEAAADELGQPMLRWLAASHMAGLLLFDGRIDEAEKRASEALSDGLAAGEPDAFAFYGAHLTFIRMEQRRLAEVVDLLAQFVASTPQLPAWAGVLANALCQLDRPDEARTILADLSADGFNCIPNDHLRLVAMCNAAEACAHLGTKVQAKQLYDHLARAAPLTAAAAIFSLGTVRRTLGVLATTLEDYALAEIHLLAAIDDNRRSPIWASTARLDLAEMYLRRGRPGDSKVVASLVADTLTSVAGLGAQRVEHRASQLAGSVTRGSADDLDP